MCILTAALVRRKCAQGNSDRHKLDGGRIQGVEGGVDQLPAEVLAGVKPPGPVDESLGEVGVDAPVALAVGIGQRAAGGGMRDAHMIEARRHRVQTGLDVA